MDGIAPPCGALGCFVRGLSPTKHQNRCKGCLPWRALQVGTGSMATSAHSIFLIMFHGSHCRLIAPLPRGHPPCTFFARLRSHEPRVSSDVCRSIGGPRVYERINRSVWCRRDTAAAFRAHPDATCALLRRRKALWTTSRGAVEAEVQAGEK